MRMRKGSLIAGILACLILIVVLLGGFEPEVEMDEWQLATEEGQYDPSRSGHDIGSCRTLSEDAAIVVLCTDDDLSSWDAESVAAMQAQTERAAQYLRDSALKYGVVLTLPVYVYASDEMQEIRYDGTIIYGDDSMMCDPLPSIAENWRFVNRWDMDETLKAELQTERIAYLVAHHSSNERSYAIDADHYWGIRGMPEYCVINFPGDVDRAATIAHEILHLFGAQDIYFDKNRGKYNESRATLAKSLCPDDIMFTTSSLEQAEISEFTAYTVGWLDELPPAYDCREWWEGTKWEDIYLPE